MMNWDGLPDKQTTSQTKRMFHIVSVYQGNRIQAPPVNYGETLWWRVGAFSHRNTNAYHSNYEGMKNHRVLTPQMNK